MAGSAGLVRRTSVENAATRASFLGTNMAMITKPFTLELVATKIRDMLGQPVTNKS